jgi:hypothetical protein
MLDKLYSSQGPVNKLINSLGNPTVHNVTFLINKPLATLQENVESRIRVAMLQPPVNRTGVARK